MRRAWGVGMFPARVYVGQIIAVFAIVIVAIWGATQWTAAALGHQAALGPAWFTVSAYPVYLPWRRRVLAFTLDPGQVGDGYSVQRP